MKYFGILAALIASIFLKAWVITKLWAWFVVAAFALPQISMPVAYGLSVLVTFVTYQFDVVSQDLSGEEGAVKLVAKALGFPLAALAFGYLTTLFM